MAVVGGRRALQGVVPRQNHLPLRPRFTQQSLALCLLHTPTMGVYTVHHKRRRVHQNLAQLGVTGAAVQGEQTGLRRNGDAHFIGDFQPGTADERFLGDEDLDVFLQLQLQIRRHLAEVRHPLAQDVAPCGRKRLTAQRAAAQRGAEGRSKQGQQNQRSQGEEKKDGHGRCSDT